MKSQWFGTPERYEFGKLLEQADLSLQYWDVFSTFLTMASCSLRQQVGRMIGRPIDDRLEQDYLNAASRVKHPDKMAQAMGVLTLALDKNPHDFLGCFSMEVGVNDKHWKGQCFTPYEVCRCMAQMLLHDAKPDSERLMLQEPACGGGAMVIASSRVLQDAGFYPWNYYWQCIDVDWRMFAACYIQTSLLGIPATVIHGNTLSGEVFESAATFAAVMHPIRNARQSIRDEPLDQTGGTGNTEAEEQPLNVQEVASVIDSGTFKQLSLF